MHCTNVYSVIFCTSVCYDRPFVCMHLHVCVRAHERERGGSHINKKVLNMDYTENCKFQQTQALRSSVNVASSPPNLISKLNSAEENKSNLNK